jgi:DNA gyrase subunit A
MKLQRLTGLEREKIIKDYEETLKEIERLKSILASPALVNNIIKDELLEIKKKYADKRRTTIAGEAQEITIEDLIPDEEMVITISHQGYIKRNPLDLYRSQRRGGKGLIGMETREEDFVQHLFIASTHNHVLFFTNLGRLYWLKVYEIPETGRAAKGKAIINLLHLSPDEKVTAVIPVDEFREDRYLFMATKRGIVKKTALKAYSNPRSTGIAAIKIDPGDELIGVRQTDGNKEIILSTREGLSIKFSEKDAREIGRIARGMIGIRLRKDDEVVSVDSLDRNTSLLAVTEKGYGKRTSQKEYRLQKRGGKGIITMKITPKNGKVVGVLQVTDEDEIIIIASGGKLIRIKASKIRIIGRSTQGVKLIDVADDNKVVGIGRVVKDDEKAE